MEKQAKNREDIVLSLMQDIAQRWQDGLADILSTTGTPQIALEKRKGGDERTEIVLTNVSAGQTIPVIRYETVLLDSREMLQVLEAVVELSEQLSHKSQKGADS